MEHRVHRTESALGVPAWILAGRSKRLAVARALRREGQAGRLSIVRHVALIPPFPEHTIQRRCSGVLTPVARRLG